MDSRHSEAFRVLGIPVDSDRATVARAYRRLALATHPDVSGDPVAAERFAALTAAYQLATEASPATASAATTSLGATTAPEAPRRPVRSPWASVRQRPPIVAGPVSIRPWPSGRASGPEA